ncbi:MBL fold metallo-hydrolase [Photobacterium sp. SDRW27]|uniref:MBL fold metallo-hydrolase RNA specificity domain-containing protein n=1 Tax=Photobacterium obscurum TaxID=2829490 RepID=UPI0022447D9D|nr:MBL fold metallo-hydrolase [Photobacterium obscurum]MCW8328257.1 MBL fold metallo-hydrolase [Photobacterium obscurum]
MQIIHHGARTGVTGSCHEVRISTYGLLVDCGLFQGEEAGRTLNIEFPIEHIKALLLTHCHIDHVGRLPWLLAAGFRGPIYATEATSALLPLMLEDGLKIHLGLDKSQCEQFTRLVKLLLKPIPFDCRAQLVLPDGGLVSICFRPAGHILGSAYIELVLPDGENVIFSGDLGPYSTPLLVDPQSPKQVGTLVIESTYGGKYHQPIDYREQQLAEIIERSMNDGGAILLPAFSVGRTQELLFDIENIISRTLPLKSRKEDAATNWHQLPVILDSPLAIGITEQYITFQRLWAKEAKQRLLSGRHPLSFKQCITVNQHSDHLAIVNRMKVTGEPAIIVAASGMCEGGRIMNYLEALLPDSRTDVILVGYQAKGTLGRSLQSQPDSVEIQNKNIKVNATVHTMSGYSAHADQFDLVKFVAGIEQGPQQIRIVHGDLSSQRALAKKLAAVKPGCEVIIAAEEGS